MSIGVASVQRKEFITASAVYYREQRCAAESAVIVVVGVIVGQVSWPNVWYRRVWNSIWYHEFWNIVRYQELWNDNGLTLYINR